MVKVTKTRMEKILKLSKSEHCREVSYTETPLSRNIRSGDVVVHRGSVLNRNGWIGLVRYVTIDFADICWIFSPEGGRIGYENSRYPTDWAEHNCRLIMREFTDMFYLPAPYGHITSRSASDESNNKEAKMPAMNKQVTNGKQNYIIWSPDPQAPNPQTIHLCSKSADDEAKRLAKVHSKTFYVARLVSQAVVELIPKVTIVSV